ncbi:MAG: hypothetical protein ACFFD2_13230 [Promethearchaeota archaeon]
MPRFGRSGGCPNFYQLYVTVIIPVIAIAELLWKMRKKSKIAELKTAITRWESSGNRIINNFDIERIKLMLKNKGSYKLHDEIIAMTWRKHMTNLFKVLMKLFKNNLN